MSQQDSVERYEKAALGLVLLHCSYWNKLSTLASDDFLLGSHRKIFNAMSALAVAGSPIDIITLVEELDSRDQLQSVGEAAYISSLVDGVPDEPSLDYYVTRIREAAGIRRIASQAECIQRQATQPGASLTDLRHQVHELEESFAAFEPKSRIASLEDIPDPFALASNEVEWLVEGLIPKKGVSLLAGEPGSGKTWFALTLARGAAMGGDFLGRSVAEAKVLYLDRENPLGLIKQRLGILCGGLGVLRPWGTWVEEQPPAIDDPRLLQFAKDGCLIVFDSLIRFHSCDENSAKEMSVVMQHLRALASAGATVFVLHHRSKSEGSLYRGSSDILAAVDVALVLGKTEDGLLSVKTVKNRFAADLTLTVRPEFAEGRLEVVDSPASIDRQDHSTKLAHIIQSDPGLSTNQIVGRSRLRKTKVLRLLESGDGRHWERQNGPRNSARYFPLRAVPEAAPTFDPGTTLGTALSTGSATDSRCSELSGTTHRFPVPPPPGVGTVEPEANS
jgi:replicative DNA helicase